MPGEVHGVHADANLENLLDLGELEGLLEDAAPVHHEETHWHQKSTHAEDDPLEVEGHIHTLHV